MKLVLLPGLDGTGVLFRPLLAALPSTLTPVVIGYPTRERLGYSELHKLVVGKLPKNDPYVIVGESFGGPLSLRIAAESPRGLRGVILAGSFVSCPFAAVPQWMEHLVHPWPFQAFPWFIKLKSRLGIYETSEHSSLSMEAISQVAPTVFAHRIREIIRVDVANELKACTVPIMYLQGQRDMIVSSANLRRILALKPTVHVVSIRSSHMILKTQPVAAAHAISEFVQNHC
jgi:pimeloyl-[acyl-carrier protein] methyl ester esterase